MFRPKEYGSAADNAGAAERHRLGSVCRGSKLDAKRHSQLLKACGPSSSSTDESVRGSKSQDKESCSRSVAATTLGTRGASGFQRFTSNYHGFHDVGIPRPRQEDQCLDGCLGSLLCWLDDTDRRGAAGSSGGRARPPASSVLSGEFKGAQLRWTVPEKEGFAIVDTVTKVDYLLLSHDEFSMLADQLNLTYIYNPLSAEPTLARHVVHKLQRYALKMSVFSYRIEHVMGELNYWTDLMTRWGVGWIQCSEHKAHGKMASLFAQPYISPPDYDTVQFPSKKETLLAQQSAVNECERFQQSNATTGQEVPPQQFDAGGMRMMNNAPWIPECEVEMQLRLCVEAHCRSEGHIAYEATLGAIKEGVAWTKMAKDFKVFVQNCLHCVATVPEDKVPRPLGTQLQATEPNEILNFDLLYIGLSRDGKYQYLLLLKDDLSGHLWLVPCRTAYAATTFDALLRWFAVFGVVLLWKADRGSHFKNEVVQRVQKELKAKHHFTAANCPWSNGPIESACKQVIRAFRAVLSELKMYADEWPDVVN
jgi:Integrase core domain/RNase H-like domain found in reverse transcriptase/Integrase zinc binding domain